LTLADAALLAAEEAEANPNRRYVVMPVSLRRPS
jgi:hypothetical protein